MHVRQGLEAGGEKRRERNEVIFCECSRISESQLEKNKGKHFYTSITGLVQGIAGRV